MKPDQLQFTRAAAAVHKITVNAILPGGFMTEPNQRWSKPHPEVIERFRANIPLAILASRRISGRSWSTWLATPLAT